MEPVSRFVIETVSGRFIDLTNPSIDDINEEDLAWGISRMPRYSTHTINELIYSVGQHSIFATETVQRAWNHKEDGIRASLMAFIERQDSLRREAMLDLWANTKQAPTLLLLGVLLHDASEAWLLDVPTPLKNLPGIKEAYGELEAQFMSLIYQKFGLDKMPDGSEGFIQWADSYTLTIEAYHLMRSRGNGWPKLMPVTLRGLQEFKAPKPSIQVYEEFKAWLGELTAT